MTDHDKLAPDTEDTPNTYTFHTAIVGVRFYDGAADLLNDISTDYTITLVREPHNKYDANAIAVHLDGGKVGHIPAPQAKILAPMLDAGRKVLAIRRRGVIGLVLTLEKEEATDATD